MNIMSNTKLEVGETQSGQWNDNSGQLELA